MSDSKRCKSCGNPVDLEVAQEHDGACPWCLAAFTFSPEAVGNPATASKDPSKQFGKYVRTEKLGAGGMGEVWKALDTELNRWVALKFLKDEDPSVVARFQREAKTAASLTHPNIAAIYEVGEIEGRHYIAMQHIEGRTMASFPKNDRRLIVRLFRDAARAVDHAHRHRIIHRDLKPDNLMVEEREGAWSVMVLDFGLARPIEGGEKLSQSGEVYGTAPYMSPEQAMGDHLDERADVYALGATMYDVLTGKAPFAGTNLLEVIRKVGHEEPERPRKINPQIHRDLETIVLKCLEKDRERRYANARELAGDLDRFLNSDPILARPPSTLYRLRMKLGKRKAVVATAAAAAVVLAVGAAYLVPKWRRADRAAAEERSRSDARGRAQPHLDLARTWIDQAEQLMTVDENRRAEVIRLFSQAREALQRALRECPEHAEALFEMARLRAAQGEEIAAIDLLTKAVASSPGLGKAHLERALVRLVVYEDRRHLCTGDVLSEDQEARQLRQAFEQDVARARTWSTELPKLKYLDGLMLFAEGRYAEAGARLGEYLQRAPTDWRAWIWRGHAYLHAEMHAAAEDSLNRALAIRPRNVDALFMRGLSRIHLGNAQGALADNTKAIELDPRLALAWANRGVARTLLKDYEEASRDIEKALEIDPNRQEIYFNRGNLKAAQLDYEGAIQDYSKAIKLSPDVAANWHNRAKTRDDLGRFDEALADFDRAIELMPKKAFHYNNRGLVLRHLGRPEKALADFERAISLDPGDASAYDNRATSRADLGDFQGALRDNDKAIELDPKAAKHRYNRGYIRERMKDTAGALAEYDKAIELDPTFTSAYLNRGIARGRLGDLTGAIRDFDEMLKLEPRNFRPYYNRGHARQLLKDLPGALKDYDRAIELDPGVASAYASRGSIRMQLRDLEGAMRDLDKAIELDPKDTSPYINRGVVKARLQDPEGAIQDMTLALERDPKSADAYRFRGLAREDLGDFERASADWKRALEVAPPSWPYAEDLRNRLENQEASRLSNEAYELLTAGKRREAIEKYKKVLESKGGGTLRINSAYNIACAYALLGEKKEALDWLEKSVEFGWKDAAHIEKDTDLDSLRGEERYRQLLKRFKSY